MKKNTAAKNTAALAIVASAATPELVAPAAPLTVLEKLVTKVKAGMASAAPAVKAPAKKAPKAPAAPAKKGGKKPAPAAPEKARDRKTNSEASVPERRMMALNAMKKLRATVAADAVTADAVAEATGLTRFDIYSLLYHTNHLATKGYVKQVKVEGVRGLSYYLTKAGVNAKVADMA